MYLLRREAVQHCWIHRNISLPLKLCRYDEETQLVGYEVWMKMCWVAPRCYLPWIRFVTTVHNLVILTLTLCVTPEFGFSPPLGTPVWKPDLHNTDRRKIIPLTWCFDDKKQWFYLDYVLGEFDLSWQLLSGVHICILAMRELWFGAIRAWFKLYSKWKMQRFSSFFWHLPCSSAVLCSRVKVVRFRCWTLFGFWPLLHSVLWLISSWTGDSKSTWHTVNMLMVLPGLMQQNLMCNRIWSTY